MEIKELLEQAKQHLAGATGLKPGTVTRAFENDDGWHVGVEMLEMSRIPTASDVLGDYEVLLTASGAMLRFERKRTRLRCDLGEDGAGQSLD